MQTKTIIRQLWPLIFAVVTGTLLAGGLAMCRADQAHQPVVKIDKPARTLIRIGAPYRAERRAFRKPRHPAPKRTGRPK